jgi:hypothetical protein
MTDERRIELATPRGSRMIGPLERQRCSRHPSRWMTYRWTWSKDGDPSSGDGEIVRGCAACEEANDEA